MVVGAAWVVRELSPALSIASSTSRRNANGTGARRINEPFPAVNLSVEPAKAPRFADSVRGLS
jgi:hypothetical protein